MSTSMHVEYVYTDVCDLCQPTILKLPDILNKNMLHINNP